MMTTSPMHEYMTGFAAWENPWPFEDSVATTTRTRRDAPPEEMIMLEAIENTTATWHKVCAFDDLDIGAGTCVLAGGQQVAIFRIAGEIVRAVQNQCPHRGAAAMHQMEAALLGPLCGVALAQKVLKACEQSSAFHCLYETDRPIREKIETIAREIYGADGVALTAQAEKQLREIIPEGERAHAHHLLIWHGRRCCFAGHCGGRSFPGFFRCCGEKNPPKHEFKIF